MESIKSNIYILNNIYSISSIRYISAYVHITDEFIEEFKDLLDWRYISLYKQFDYKFYNKYKDRLTDDLIHKNHLSKYVLKSKDTS